MIIDKKLEYVKQHMMPDGSVYQGYILPQNDQVVPEGYGVVKYGDGARFEGEFHNGRPNGLGKLLLENGDTYEGQWLDDQCSGYGCLTSSTKTY